MILSITLKPPDLVFLMSYINNHTEPYKATSNYIRVRHRSMWQGARRGGKGIARWSGECRPRGWNGAARGVRTSTQANGSKPGAWNLALEPGSGHKAGGMGCGE